MFWYFYPMKFGKSIALVGLGNVGTQLADYLLDNGFHLTQIFVRDFSKIPVKIKASNIEIVNDLKAISTDYCIVCVSDSSLNTVINQIPENVKIGFTSGSIGLSNLDRKENMGVFYPLQTFTTNRTVDWKQIPFLIESNDEGFQQELLQLANEISSNVQIVNSTKRREIHLAAVFINNFINHQIFLAEEIARNYQFDVKLLHPLLKETIEKAISLGAYDSQTGPAKRKDENVIEAHIKMLDSDQFKSIYKVLTQSIISTYHSDEL